MVKQSKTSFDFSKVHFVPQTFKKDIDAITIDLIGIGGTGSQVAMGIARINYALIDSGRAGLQVRLFDPDSVSCSNIGRQLFTEAEIGFNKAIAITSRINRVFGTNWEGYNTKWNNSKANITISCVDSVTERWKIHNKIIRRKKIIDTNSESFKNRRYYWIDTGNDYNFGQIILGTCGVFKQVSNKSVKKLPNIFDLYPDFNKEEREDKPSCSLAVALQKQDLFINGIIAQYTCNLLWKLLTKDYINHHGIYINLDTLKTNPILF